MEEGSSRYEKIDFLGEGQFATVYKARDKNTDTIVAVKKIKLGSRTEAADGINRTALREIKLLQELSHENIIGLQDVFGQKSNVSLVFDFMETDLEVVIRDTNIIMTASHIKSYTLQTLLGLEYLHANWVLHRDMKPNNLLINDKGVVKIGDFGLAKFFGSPSRPYSHQVVTRWYRCPELLYGARSYGEGVDIWSVGCIVAELLIRDMRECPKLKDGGRQVKRTELGYRLVEHLRRHNGGYILFCAPFLPGETDLDQLSRIFQVLGTPTEADWPDMKCLPDYISFKEFPKHPMNEIFTAAGDDLLEVLDSCLAINPNKRCSASQCLQLPYFSNRPPPTPSEQLPFPKSNKIVDKEKETKRQALKRKQNGDAGGLKKRLVF